MDGGVSLYDACLVCPPGTYTHDYVALDPVATAWSLASQPFPTI